MSEIIEPEVALVRNQLLVESLIELAGTGITVNRRDAEDELVYEGSGYRPLVVQITSSMDLAEFPDLWVYTGRRELGGRVGDELFSEPTVRRAIGRIMLCFNTPVSFSPQ